MERIDSSAKEKKRWNIISSFLVVRNLRCRLSIRGLTFQRPLQVRLPLSLSGDYAMDRAAYTVVFRGLAVSILLAVSVDIRRDTRFTAAQNCKGL